MCCVMNLFLFAARQSPINIITADVVQNPNLSAFELSESWTQATASGTFSNLGHNVQFTLAANSPAITTTFPVGEYKFLQMHMHWGNRTGTGSEHRFDGEQTEVEIHFVHKRMTQEGTTSENGLGVIGVYAEVSETPVSGFWATLNASRVQNSGDEINITDFMLSSMLPTNVNTTDYYHYAGGLTTPNCTETVQFFLLRQRIPVPAAYLTYLRSTTDDAGEPLDFNYRDLQGINGRIVEIPGSSAMVSASLMLVAAVALLAVTGISY